ncbi:carbamoyl-phosphate synthetase-aspartate transcarbamoylase dihydroorotase, partial [Lentinula raphanica]
TSWLKEKDVPAIYGVDTRVLTKKIQERGSMLGKLLARNPAAHSGRRLVIDTSLSATPSRASLPNSRSSWREDYLHLLHPSGRPIRVLFLDVGMKYNQIWCFINRGVEIKVLPWDYDFLSALEPYDGLFMSNGPGDPTLVSQTIARLSEAMERADKPIFGIQCLEHQLMALAAGATTSKMKYRNRGHTLTESALCRRSDI